MRVEVVAGVARLLIDRPAKRNSMTVAMFDAIPALLAEAEADDRVRAILLTSAHAGVFCAGADIGELAANADQPDWRAANQAAINAAQFALARVGRATVAFIDGDCVGGGCGLALACDIRVATPRARFGITPAKLGLVYPLHDTKLLVDLIGPGQAKRILYTGDLLDAAEARRIGLIDMIAEEPDDLLDRIAANSRHSQREAKRMIRRILDGQVHDDDATLTWFAAAFEGDDFREGVEAFLAKRRPDFT